MSWWWPFGSGALNNPDKGSQDSNPPYRKTDANIVVTDERAMMISTVFACVRLLVQSGSTMPLGFYVKTKDGRDPLSPSHPLSQLLKYKPNSYMTAKEFRSAMWTQRVLWGNAYARIKWVGTRPVSIVPLKPAQMEVKRGTEGLVYFYSTDEGVREYTQKDIMHIKGFSVDGIVGLSALGYSRHTLGLSVGADQSAGKAISGNTTAVLEMDDVPTPAQKEKLREMYGSGNATTELSNNLMITVGGMKYRNISMPPDDLQLLESRAFNVPEICRFFGVPAVMVDGSAGATAAWPASYEQQVLSFLTFTLKPYLEEWEDVVSDSLLTSNEKQTIYAEHNVDGLLRTDSASRASFYASAVQNGWMTRAEVRQKENLKPIEGSDELTVQVNLTPLQELEKVGETNAEPNPEPATDLQPEVSASRSD